MVQHPCFLLTNSAVKTPPLREFGNFCTPLVLGVSAPDNKICFGPLAQLYQTSPLMRLWALSGPRVGPIQIF